MSPPKFCDENEFDDDDDEFGGDDTEMVALMPPTTHNETEQSSSPSRRERRNSWGSNCPSESLEGLQTRSRLGRSERVRSLRQLMMMRGGRSGDGGVGAYRCGLILVLISSLMMIRWWVQGSSHSDSDGHVHRWKRLCLKDIKHWCLDPNSHTCESQCANPLEPNPRLGHKTWELAHDGNIRDAYEKGTIADVVFLGDSITEGWRGMSFGLPVQHKQPNLNVFNRLFSKEAYGDDAEFEGMALGIAGDKSPHLLWRIQNGEVPKELQPSVWWILIGTNDFLRGPDYCSPEVVLMGIQRVVEEMRQRKPGSKIVVNGLLPRSAFPDGSLVDDKHPKQPTVWTAIKDVNAALEEYCQKYKNVLYFDATDIFVQRKNEAYEATDSNLYIPQRLMEDFLHPTAAGYQKWGEQITEALHLILDADRSAEGRKPLPPFFGGKDKPDLSALPSRQENHQQQQQQHAGGDGRKHYQLR